MPTIHKAYHYYERAKRGKYPDARYHDGKIIKDWITSIDETFSDELLSEALKRDKRNVVFPTIVFLIKHPGYVNGEDGYKLAEDFKHMQGVYYRYIKRLELATDGKSEASHDLYERSRAKLLESVK